VLHEIFIRKNFRTWEMYLICGLNTSRLGTLERSRPLLRTNSLVVAVDRVGIRLGVGWGECRNGGGTQPRPTPTINGITRYKQTRPYQTRVFNAGGENFSKSPTLTS